MIYIFGTDDRLKLIATNDNTDALPVISATMHEIINGDYKLDFEVPLYHAKAALINSGDSAAVKRENGSWELFRISSREELKPEGVLQLQCRHAIRELEDEKVDLLHYFDDEATFVLPDLLMGTRWQTGTILGTDAFEVKLHNTNKLEALKQILQIWGLEISYRFTITGGQITERIIDASYQMGAWAGRRFEWQQDLLGVTRTIDESKVKTALIGVGKIAADTVEPAPTDTANWHVNMLGSRQQDPLELDDLKGWTFGGSVTEAIETDLPAGITSADHSFSVTQRGANSTYMVINTAYQKVNVVTKTFYTASIYVKCNEAKQCAVYLEFIPTGKGTTVTFFKNVTVAANTWTRIDIGGTSPTYSSRAMIEARVNNSIKDVTKLYYAAAKLEKGTLTPFENPDLPPVTAADEDKEEYKDELYFTDVVWSKTKNPPDPLNKPINENFIADPTARDLYGYYDRATGTKRHRWGYYVNTEITDPAQLLQATYEALVSVSAPIVSYGLKVLDLAKLEGKLYKMVYLGDTVAVIDDELKLQKQARCLEIKHNLIQKEDTDLILETFQDNFTGGTSTMAGGGKVTDPVERIDQLETAMAETIHRGDIIRTDWLEEEMRAVIEGMKGGNSTVTFSDTEGILIEEDPEFKIGGALKLAAGVLALANEYDFRTGDYIWRTFGTGEGFLADLVEAGKISFNSAEGGTLKLGGRIVGYEKEDAAQTVTWINKVKADGDLSRESFYRQNSAIEELPANVINEVWGYPDFAVRDDDKYLTTTITNNTKLKARYIRDYLNGSTANLNNYWNEIKAMSGTVNRAAGKLPTISSGTLTNAVNVTDGNNTTYGYEASGNGVAKYVQIDLGAVYSDIDNIQVIHYYLDGRTHHATKTQISEDGVTWTTLFDSAVSGEYVETSAGKTYTQTNVGSAAGTHIQFIFKYIVDPVDLTSLDFNLSGTLGQPFTLKPYNFVTADWDLTQMVEYTGGIDKEIVTCHLEAGIENYVDADGTVYFSAFSTNELYPDSSLTFGFDYCDLDIMHFVNTIPLYENGKLVVYNEDGELIADLDANTGGFSELYVGDLDSPTVTSYTDFRISGDRKFYIAEKQDAAGGVTGIPDDANDGSSWLYPMKTVEACLAKLPQCFDGNVFIYMATTDKFNENITITGLLGNGSLTIDGQTKSTTLIGSISASRCTVGIYLKNMTINSTSDYAVVTCSNADVTCSDVTVNGISGNGTQLGFDCIHNGFMQLTNCEAYSVQRAFSGRYGATCTLISGNKGYGSICGLWAYGGYITGGGTAPAGVTNASTSLGGQIWGSFTYDSGSYVIPVPPETTKTITSTTGDNWNGSSWMGSGDGVKQGNYGYGNRTGAWFFPSITGTIGTGKTIKSMRVWISRISGHGSSAAARHSIRYHKSSSRPSGNVSISNEIGHISLGWGKSGWATISSAYYAAFANGTAKGISIYTADGKYYSRCSLTCKIEIVYS